MGEKIIVIGAGQAAVAFASKLRSFSTDVEITLIGEEPHLPYQRPPLSKAYVKGETSLDGLALRAPQWYDDNNIVCRTNLRVQSVDTDKNQVHLSNGEAISFDRLVFATGSRPRTLPEAMGGNLDEVMVIRSIQDADKMKAYFTPQKHVLIIGGGYIGLEAAAVAASKDMEVTLVEMADRILQRVASPQTSDYFRALHEKNGVRILENTGLDHFNMENGKIVGAKLSNGDEIAVDMAIVGIGVSTNSEIAQEAGLEIDNGIAVNAHCQTSNSNIYACGDCASFPYKGSRIRLESVQNAIDQAENVAQNIASELLNEVELASKYQPFPWFWSDQYDTKLQIAGLNTGYDQVVFRESEREGAQSLWYFAKGEFLAVDSMNDAKAYMVGKRLLEMGKTISPEEAGDSSLDIKSLLKR